MAKDIGQCRTLGGLLPNFVVWCRIAAPLFAVAFGLCAFPTTGHCDQTIKRVADGETSAAAPHAQDPLAYDLASPPGRLLTYCTSSRGGFVSVIQIPLNEFPFLFAPVSGRQRTVFYATAHCGTAQQLDVYDPQILGQTAGTDGPYLVYNIGFSSFPAKLYVSKDKGRFFICQPDLRASLPRLCNGSVILASGKKLIRMTSMRIFLSHMAQSMKTDTIFLKSIKR